MSNGKKRRINNIRSIQSVLINNGKWTLSPNNMFLKTSYIDTGYLLKVTQPKLFWKHKVDNWSDNFLSQCLKSLKNEDDLRTDIYKINLCSNEYNKKKWYMTVE